MSYQTPKDDHGQPVSTRIRKAAVQSRNIDELVGICRGIVFDDVVTQNEAERLLKWLSAQPDLIQVWPANMLYQRLTEILSDGVVDQSEAAELLHLLNDLIGNSPDLIENIDTETGEYSTDIKTTHLLPISKPVQIFYKQNDFVLTGKFASGTRNECESEILRRGGYCQKGPTKTTRYMIIGSFGSRDWAHSSWGRKIEKAVEMKHSGHEIEIISEEHWIKTLS